MSMNTYRCHTEVDACRIARIEQKPSAKSTWNGEWLLIPEGDGEPVTVDNSWYLANRPSVGEYYVVHSNGRYTKTGVISGDEFEAEYSLVDGEEK